MELIYFLSAEELRYWLEENHQASECWMGLYKKGSRRMGITYKEAVDEMSCFAWVEVVRKSIDESSYKIRFTPRRPKGNWSAKSIERTERLLREGRMHPVGIKAYENRVEDDTEELYNEEGEPVLPPELQAQLEGESEAWEFFQSLSPSVRRITIRWVSKAKQAETRERRLGILIESSLEERKIPLLRGPGD